MVDFPQPDDPTKAVLVCGLNVRLKLESTGAVGREG